ncbi:hypothetical protein LS70_009035 [Helicobacter sp. MIT 11-5569]|uniref:hypothetical protein n=1 Tax=Helicobacter sp. MIT 11-5569 TaxID=1548151 RepID=UPI00051F8930|nr:hypothetical protein [Helicobacter sp. MIT 11-5569]TLD80609.1 hypothetical protein LS70_009035 [Helicobacter sp. MIT 11-5569]
MKKKFLQQACLIAVSSLLLSACSQKYHTLPNTRVVKTCPTLLVTYEFGFLKQGEYDDLNLPNERIKSLIQEGLEQSGCFGQTQVISDAYKHYRLDVVYGNISTRSARGGFFHSQTSDALVFEVQLSFNRMDETRIFYGKSSLQNDNEQYWQIFGQPSTLDANEIQITIQNAINSAINEASRSFLKQ